MLIALGPGGTTELAERALQYARTLTMRTIPVRRPEPGGLTEVAAELGVSRQTVGHWIAGRRGPGNFPEPRWSLAQGKVWELAEVREWRAAWTD
jgi:hypothetical protein